LRWALALKLITAHTVNKVLVKVFITQVFLLL
jgi:hypothetical protein